MTLYLSALTNEELLSYADSYAETPLEKELLKRLETFLKEADDAV